MIDNLSYLSNSTMLEKKVLRKGEFGVKGLSLGQGICPSCKSRRTLRA